jgi:hypothetical protein
MIHAQPDAAEAVDEIAALLPGIPEPEFALRKRLRSARNVAAAALVSVPPGGTHDLFHMINEVGTSWVYRPSSTVQLTHAVELCRLLWQASQVAEKLEGLDG